MRMPSQGNQSQSVQACGYKSLAEVALKVLTRERVCFFFLFRNQKPERAYTHGSRTKLHFLVYPLRAKGLLACRQRVNAALVPFKNTTCVQARCRHLPANKAGAFPTPTLFTAAGHL